MHHCVYHLNKLGNIRAEFNLIADYKVKCRNRELLSGPNLKNQIFGALLRFREDQVAVMGSVHLSEVSMVG